MRQMERVNGVSQAIFNSRDHGERGALIHYAICIRVGGLSIGFCCKVIGILNHCA